MSPENTDSNEQPANTFRKMSLEGLLVTVIDSRRLQTAQLVLQVISERVVIDQTDKKLQDALIVANDRVEVLKRMDENEATLLARHELEFDEKAD